MSKLFDYGKALLMGNNQMSKYPGDTDIWHLTLNTCHGCYISGGNVPPKEVDAYRPLLKGCLGTISREQTKVLEKAGGTHALPYSDGKMGILVTSDPLCHGNEISFSIYERARSKNPILLVYGRYYDAIDKTAPRKWEQLVYTFVQSLRDQTASPYSGFDSRLLIDPPQTPWVGVILTKAYEVLGASNPELGCSLSVAEQAIALTWREICAERDSGEEGWQSGGRIHRG